MAKTPLKLFLQITALLLLSFFLLVYVLPNLSKDSGNLVHKEKLIVPKNLQKAAAVESDKEQTVALHNIDMVYPGFTLYPQAGNETVQLINMLGESVHEWKLDVARARLLPDCSLLVIHGSKWGLKREPWRSLRHILRRYSWNGDVLWEYVGDPEAPFHHDIAMLENGNVLALRRANFPDQLRSQVLSAALQDKEIRSDEVLEISPTGKITWNWFFHDHLDINRCGKYRCDYSDVLKKKKDFDWSHLNTLSVLQENKLSASGDNRFRAGNILLTARNWSTVLLIDKESKSVVWRYTGDYRGGLEYGHEAHMIDETLPGAGNILLFDNGVQRGHSVMLEVNPLNNKTVWVFDIGKSLYSPAAGSLQRLQNGNTLIAEDMSGRVLEVTPEKEIVWEFFGNRIRTARPRKYDQNYCPQFANLPLR